MLYGIAEPNPKMPYAVSLQSMPCSHMHTRQQPGLPTPTPQPVVQPYYFAETTCPEGFGDCQTAEAGQGKLIPSTAPCMLMHEVHTQSQSAWQSPVESRAMLLLSLDRVPLLSWYTPSAGLHDRLTSGVGWLLGTGALTSALIMLSGGTRLLEACMPAPLSASHVAVPGMLHQDQHCLPLMLHSAACQGHSQASWPRQAGRTCQQSIWVR